MFDRLEKLVERYDELTNMLADPAVTSNMERYRDLGKEHSGLTGIVRTYLSYKKTRSDLANLKSLAESSDDPEMRQLASGELAETQTKLSKLEEDLKALLIPKDPNDDKDCIVEIRGGTGGDEAALFAADLYRMYTRYAERAGWKTEMLDWNDTGKGGFKEVIFSLKGENAYGTLKYESGVHRVQRVPETEAQGRVHTSAATVAVLPEVEEVDVKIEDKDLRIDVFRSGGPGGQSVNTTDIAVRGTHLPTGPEVTCQDQKA